MTLGKFATLTRRAAWLGFVVLCLALLVLGCSTTRMVTVPAQETSVERAVPDSTQETMLPPPEPIGRVTRPEEVILYEDTATYDVDLSWLEVDRTGEDEAVAVRTQKGSQTVEKRFKLPAYGEALQLRADSQGLQGSVQGTPQERQREATAIEVPWWKQVGRKIRLVIAFAGGIVFGVFGAKLFL